MVDAFQCCLNTEMGQSVAVSHDNKRPNGFLSCYSHLAFKLTTLGVECPIYLETLKPSPWLWGFHWHRRSCLARGWDCHVQGRVRGGLALGEPELVRYVIFFIRHLNHGYLMPPIHCLGASGFLPVSCPCCYRPSVGSCIFIMVLRGSGSSGNTRFVGAILHGEGLLRNSGLRLSHHRRRNSLTLFLCSC